MVQKIDEYNQAFSDHNLDINSTTEFCKTNKKGYLELKEALTHHNKDLPNEDYVQTEIIQYLEIF